jgi:hypothetical protein
LQPSLSPHQLITFIWNELTGETDPVAAPWMLDTAELIRHLLFKLKALHDSGKLTVIVIDEAHNMPVETLESLRLLSNLETDKQKLVQIVLAGQPELDAKLARHELRQLNQRIAMRTRIDNLSAEEAIAYIQYRLDMAAGRPIEVFTKGALDYIAKVSGGNPRRLNIFCDNALINALGYRARLVTRAIAAEAIAPHLTTERTPRPQQLTRYALAATVLLALALGIGYGTSWFRGGAAVPSPVSRAHDDIGRQVATLPREKQPVVDMVPRVVDDKMVVTAPPTPPGSAITYKVETQQTLDALCKLAYGICGPAMVRTLAQANPTIDPGHLVAGQAIGLPVIENIKPAFP